MNKGRIATPINKSIAAIFQGTIASTCGLVAMTSASHAEGRQFDPGQVYLEKKCYKWVPHGNHGVIFNAADENNIRETCASASNLEPMFYQTGPVDKCDSEGIRTPAGRAQWISSPSP